MKKRDRVSAELHFNVCEEIRVKLENKHWHDHVTESVKTNNEGKVAILWNQQVRTVRTSPNNKPDSVIRDTKQGTCMLIDAAVSRDRNLIKKPKRFYNTKTS